MRRLTGPLGPRQKRFPGILGWIGTLLVVMILGGTIAFLILSQRIIVTSGTVITLPDSGKVLLQIRNIGRLETVSYTLEKVYPYDRNANSPWYDLGKYLGDQRKLFVVPGEVIAGFDLTRLRKEDVQIQGKAITINLPPPQILTVSIDEKNVQVYDMSTGVYSFMQGMDPNTENQVLAAGKVSLQKDACDGGILQKASASAKQQFTSFLTELGFTSVTINIPKGTC